MKEIYGPGGEVIRRFHPADDGGFVLSATQDVEPIIRQTEALQNDPGTNKDKSMKRVGSIPFVEIERLSAELGVNIMALPTREQWKIYRRFFKENPRFRSSSGAV